MFFFFIFKLYMQELQSKLVAQLFDGWLALTQR